MAGGNPLAPPGGAPVGGGPQGPGAGRTPQVGRSPFDGAGAPILAPGGPPQSSGLGQQGPNTPASKQGQPFADVHNSFKQAKALYNDNKKAEQVLSHLRVELDGLMEKGDLVRPEDVIEAAGRLVGHGIGASQLAQIMSDMPAQGGEGLAGWVRMHDLTVFQAEQQMINATKLAQHNMGVAAVSSMAATHLGSSLPSGGPEEMPEEMPEGNELSSAPMRGRPMGT